MTASPFLLCSAVGLLGALASACDTEDDLDDPITDLDSDEVVMRDLSSGFRGVPVLIESLDDGSCLWADPASGPYLAEVACDASDPGQHFTFDVETYVGGLGFVYRVCSVLDASMCLTHTNNGTVFLDPGPAYPGWSYRQIRIQQDETDLHLEFRRSGRCLTKGPVYSAPVTQTCNFWSSDAQRYQLHLATSSPTCEGRCGDYDPSEACQCDAACTSFGDCCDDYGPVCDPGDPGDGGGGAEQCAPNETCCEPTPSGDGCWLCIPDGNICP